MSTITLPLQSEGIDGSSSGSIILKKKREILKLSESDIESSEMEVVKKLNEALAIARDLGLDTEENEFAQEQFTEMCIDLGLLNEDVELVKKKLSARKNSKESEDLNHDENIKMKEVLESNGKSKNPATNLEIALTGTNFVFRLDASKYKIASDESPIETQSQEKKCFSDYDLLKQKTVDRCKKLVISNGGCIGNDLKSEVLKETEECQSFLYQLSLKTGNLSVQKESIAQNISLLFKEFDEEIKAEQKRIEDEHSSKKSAYRQNLKALNERDSIRIKCGDKEASKKASWDVLARAASMAGIKDDPEWNKIVEWHERETCQLLENIPSIFESLLEKHMEVAWDKIASVINFETYDSRRTRLKREEHEKEMIEKKRIEDLEKAKIQVGNLSELKKIDQRQFEISLIDFIVTYPKYDGGWLMLIEEIAINEQNSKELLEVSSYLGADKILTPLIENRKAVLEVKAKIENSTPAQLISLIKGGTLSVLSKKDLLELFDKYPEWSKLAEKQDNEVVLTILSNLLDLSFQIQEGNAKKASQIILELEKYASDCDSIHFINCAMMVMENANKEKLEELFLKDYLITCGVTNDKTLGLLDKFQNQQFQIEIVKKEFILFRDSLDEDICALIQSLLSKNGEINQLILSILPFFKVRKFLLKKNLNFLLDCIYSEIKEYSQKNNPIDLIDFLSNLCLAFQEDDLMRAKEFSDKLSGIEDSQLAFLMHQLAYMILDFDNISSIEKGLLTIWSENMEIEIPMIEGVVNAYNLSDVKMNKLVKISLEIKDTFGGYEGKLVKQLHNSEKIKISLLHNLYNYFYSLKRSEYAKAQECFVQLKDCSFPDELKEFIRISEIQMRLGVEGKLTEEISRAIAGLIAEGNFSFLILKEKCHFADFSQQFNEVIVDMVRDLRECQSRVVEYFKNEMVDLHKFVPESSEENKNKIVDSFNELFFQGIFQKNNKQPLVFYYSIKENVSVFITQDGFFAMHPNNKLWFYPHLVIKKVDFETGLANAYYTVTKVNGKPVEHCKNFGFFGTFDSNSNQICKNVCVFEAKILASIPETFGKSRYLELLTSLANNFPAAYIEFSVFARDYGKTQNPYDYDTSVCPEIADSTWLHMDANGMYAKISFDGEGSILVEKDAKKSDSGNKWRQEGRKILVFSKDELRQIGTLFGDRIQGVHIEKSGKRAPWSAFRLINQKEFCF